MVRTRLALYLRKRYDKYVTLIKKLRPAPTMGTTRSKVQESPRRNVTLSEQKEAGRSIVSQWFLIYIVKTVSLVALYYLFSIGLTFYQKKFIQVPILFLFHYASIDRRFLSFDFVVFRLSVDDRHGTFRH